MKTNSILQSPWFQGVSRDVIVGSMLTLIALGALCMVGSGVANLEAHTFCLNPKWDVVEMVIGALLLSSVCYGAYKYVKFKKNEEDEGGWVGCPEGTQEVTFADPMEVSLCPQKVYPEIPQEDPPSLERVDQLSHALQKKEFFCFMGNEMGVCIVAEVGNETVLYFHENDRAFKKKYQALAKEGFKEVFAHVGNDGWEISKIAPTEAQVERQNKILKEERIEKDKRYKKDFRRALTKARKK